jgi:hypothetical protein
VTAVTVQCPIKNPIGHCLVCRLTCNGRETVTAVTDISLFHSHTCACARALRLICKLRSLRSLFRESPQVNRRFSVVTDRALSTSWNGELRAVTARD